MNKNEEKKIMNKKLFFIRVFEFGVVINVPSLNPLALGTTRTELIEEIWDNLNVIRGPPVRGRVTPSSNFHGSREC